MLIGIIKESFRFKFGRCYNSGISACAAISGYWLSFILGNAERGIQDVNVLSLLWISGIC